MAAADIFELFAAVLEYPAEGYRERLNCAITALAEVQPEAGTLLAGFERATERLTLEELQELYTQTFDLNPVCSLEVGWHLYGENYERGEFLVQMRQHLRQHGIAESRELPDHLTHVLALLGRVETVEAGPFVARLFPALDKMRAGLRGKNNPFEGVLDSLALCLESEHPRPARKNSPDAVVLRVLD